jgi:hypothetical protein
MTVTSTRGRRLAAAIAALCAFAGVNAATSSASADDQPGHQPGHQPEKPRLTGAQRMVLLEATAKFRDIRRAIAAGYQPTDECVPGMGYHYGRPALAGDTNVDPTMPEILVYARDADGSLRLAALEFFRADADGDKTTTEDRPTLFGHPFDGPMDGHPVPPGAPPMPVHYDLHVWLYWHNPAGELSSENPAVRCP